MRWWLRQAGSSYQVSQWSSVRKDVLLSSSSPVHCLLRNHCNHCSTQGSCLQRWLFQSAFCCHSNAVAIWQLSMMSSFQQVTPLQPQQPTPFRDLLTFFKRSRSWMDRREVNTVMYFSISNPILHCRMLMSWYQSGNRIWSPWCLFLPSKFCAASVILGWLRPVLNHGWFRIGHCF